MIYVGVISEVKGTKARVAVDGLTTDYLPVLQIANSFKQSWTPIKEREQCMILAPTGDINNGCILRGLYYSDFPAPATDIDSETTVYADGTQISYSTSAKELTIKAVGNVTINCVDASVKATGSVLIDSPSVDIGKEGGTGVITQECICSITGLPHPEASAIVRAVK